MSRLGPFPGTITPEFVRDYAVATRDPNPGAVAGDVVPTLAIVTQIWDAQLAAFSKLIPDDARASMTGGVHGEHDVVIHRPIRPGEELSTFVEPWGSRRGGRHNLVTMRYRTYDAHKMLIAEQWWTTVLLNATGEPTGDAAPTHDFADDARDRLIGEAHLATDTDMPRQYAEVSGDWSPHHFDEAAAQLSGFARPFLHGLCTTALCAQQVVALVADGDHNRVRRVAVRFASPTFVGDDVALRVFSVDARTSAFEATAGGADVIRNGLLELR